MTPSKSHTWLQRQDAYTRIYRSQNGNLQSAGSLERAVSGDTFVEGLSRISSGEPLWHTPTPHDMQPQGPLIEGLPDGSSIGQMEAPLQWIFSHTSRFQGGVRIRMQDAEGFLLVEKGRPRAALLRHPVKSLKGLSALRYFSTQPTIAFDLRKYSPDEMREALTACTQVQCLIQQPDCQSLFDEEELSPAPADTTARSDAPAIEAPGAGTEPSPMTSLVRHEGVVAVAQFSEGLCIHSSGNIDPEYVVAIAEDLLRWATGLESVTQSGSFVQMTTFYRDGNVIITPYGDEFLCIFTTPDMQYGQIRRMIRDLQSDT